ncbi:MAG TPA: sigma-70 family RNA polymerase sigma factor [Xanthobacteraceae bacterium]|jgi:RNA polymerase sigma-70 factor (ECF subfamily)|nr:sigma-70 family RNA polymerase sigma factor [Xanthobacteraceae bacterium]
MSKFAFLMSRERMTALSDAVLIKQIADGDRSAMRTLFERHQVKVYRFILRIVRDAALAEDTVSETFIDAWQHAGRYAGRSSVSSWLIGIARHRALDAARRRPTESLECDAAQNAVDPALDPEAELGQKDTRTVVRNALSALSREHAEIIDLVYYQEKSIREIAEIVGIPESTVKTRMFYARKRLAALVATAGIERAAA